MTETEVLCYVCQEEESKDSSFCKTNICGCKGSNRIHISCFQKLRNQELCSICKKEFKNVSELIIEEILELQKVTETDSYGWKHEYHVDQRGRKQGLHRIFYLNGTLWEENEYKNDIRNGYQKVWSHKGKLFVDTKFKNGVEMKDV